MPVFNFKFNITLSTSTFYDILNFGVEWASSPVAATCYTPANEVWGVYRNHPVCLSVRPSVCLSRVNFTLVITFKPLEIRLSYYTCWFLVIRPFYPYQKIWPCDLDLDIWPTFEKNLTLAITFEPREIRLSYYRYVFLVARPFCPYQKFWPCDLNLDFWPTFEKT